MRQGRQRDVAGQLVSYGMMVDFMHEILQEILVYKKAANWFFYGLVGCFLI